MAELREIEVGSNRADIERNRLLGAGLVGDPFPASKTGFARRGPCTGARYCPTRAIELGAGDDNT